MSHGWNEWLGRTSTYGGRTNWVIKKEKTGICNWWSSYLYLWENRWLAIWQCHTLQTLANGLWIKMGKLLINIIEMKCLPPALIPSCMCGTWKAWTFEQAPQNWVCDTCHISKTPCYLRVLEQLGKKSKQLQGSPKYCTSSMTFYLGHSCTSKIFLFKLGLLTFYLLFVLF